MTTEATPVAADDAAMPEAQAETQPSQSDEPTSRQAIERAFAKIDEGDASADQGQGVEADASDTEDGDRPANKSETRERGDDGRFKATDKEDDAKPSDDQPADDQEIADSEKADTPQDQFSEAPSRFSADAKKAWADAPLPVRAEIDRAINELQSGIEQHRSAFEPYRAFDAELKQRGQNFPEVLAHYRGIETMLAQDPMRGLDTICQNMGTSLRQVAEQVTGKTPDQNAAAQENVIRELRNEIAGLKQGLNGVSTSIQTDKQAQVTRQITDFAAQNTRFEELSGDIALLLNMGKAATLQDAYAQAERLNPVAAQLAPVTPAAEADQKPKRDQTRKADLSLSGAPSSGSNPGSRPSESTRQALDGAFSALGL